MDHAEALGRIEDAVAAPGGLVRLNGDSSPEAVALRAHVSGCPTCAAEWRAWSVVSLGLAAVAPDTLGPRPSLRDDVMTAAAARTGGTTTADDGAAAAPSPAAAPSLLSPDPTVGTGRSGITIGSRRPRSVPTQGPAGSSAPTPAPRFRWLLLGAAGVVVLFVAGMLVGRQLVGAPEASRGGPGRVLAEAATILQGSGFGIARLTTPDGKPGGVVVVSPGSGRLAVVSSALPVPADGTRYVCLLDRGGVVTQVGYMRWDPTADGGGIAYWAGPAEPPDLGLQGDLFIVMLDAPGAQPALTGQFGG